MKKGRRITKFTVETERTFIFRNRGGSRAGFCDRCGHDVELMAVADAAIEADQSELAIYQLIQAGSVHFVEDDGRIFICFSSLHRIQQRLDQEEGEIHED
jgi:hypothetical protein